MTQDTLETLVQLGKKGYTWRIQGALETQGHTWCAWDSTGNTVANLVTQGTLGDTRAHCRHSSTPGDTGHTRDTVTHLMTEHTEDTRATCCQGEHLEKLVHQRPKGALVDKGHTWRHRSTLETQRRLDDKGNTWRNGCTSDPRGHLVTRGTLGDKGVHLMTQDTLETWRHTEDSSTLGDTAHWRHKGNFVTRCALGETGVHRGPLKTQEHTW